MNLAITRSLINALGELYYREGCDQEGWAYISLKNIHNSISSSDNRFKDNAKDNYYYNNNTLVFNKGVHRIRIKLIKSIVLEIIEVCRPLNNNNKSSDNDESNFVFDYLACKVGQSDKHDDGGIIVANPMALAWIMISVGGIKRFSDAQIDALEKIKLPLALFSIRDVLAPPRKVEMKWDIRSGEKWLNEVDDLKEQTEYDDEYF